MIVKLLMRRLSFAQQISVDFRKEVWYSEVGKGNGGIV